MKRRGTGTVRVLVYKSEIRMEGGDQVSGAGTLLCTGYPGTTEESYTGRVPYCRGREMDMKNHDVQDLI